MALKRILPFLVAVVLVGGGFWYYEANAGGSASTGREVPVGSQQGVGVGMLAPEFSLPGLLGGTTVSLRSLLAEGRPVYLNFWATWCPSCKHEIPDIKRIQTTYGNRVTIVGVDEFNSEAGLAAVKKFIRKHGMNYRIVLDTNNQVGNEYLVTALPVSVFISPHGVIRQYNLGAMNYADLQAAMNLVLNS